MKRSFTFSLLLSLTSLLGYTQEKEIPEAFRYAIISMEMPAKEKTLQEKRDEETTRRFQKYVDSLNKYYASQTYADPNVKDLSLNSSAQLLSNCVNDFANNGSLSNLQKTIKTCKNHIDDMSTSEWDLLKKKGIDQPEEFKKSMKAEIDRLEREINRKNKPSEIAVVSNFMTLDEVDEQDLDLVQAIDPNVLSLSNNVQALLVEYYNSPDLKSLLLQQELAGVPTGQEELIEFTQILDLINNPKNKCWANGTMKKIEDSPVTLTQLRGLDKDQNQKDFGHFLFGVDTSEELSKIEGYKFRDNEGQNFYLYHGKKSNIGEDVWVMAKVNPKGEMSFRYYQFNEGQDKDKGITTDHDIKILTSKVHQTNLKTTESKRIYFEAQEGMVLQGNKADLPILGEVNIPRDKIVIGQVRMVYVTPSTFTQNTMTVDSQYMTFGTQTRPSNNNDWSAGGGVRFNPINQRVQVSGNVRVLNLSVAYNDNLAGSKSGSVSYIVDNSYAGFTTNLNNSFNLAAGRQFKSGQGGVTASTNFKNSYEVKLVLFLDPKKKRETQASLPSSP